jgi:hypothetical protein
MKIEGTGVNNQSNRSVVETTQTQVNRKATQVETAAQKIQTAAKADVNQVLGERALKDLTISMGGLKQYLKNLTVELAQQEGKIVDSQVENEGNKQTEGQKLVINRYNNDSKAVINASNISEKLSSVETKIYQGTRQDFMNANLVKNIFSNIVGKLLTPKMPIAFSQSEDVNHILFQNGKEVFTYNSERLTLDNVSQKMVIETPDGDTIPIRISYELDETSEKLNTWFKTVIDQNKNQTDVINIRNNITGKTFDGLEIKFVLKNEEILFLQSKLDESGNIEKNEILKMLLSLRLGGTNAIYDFDKINIMNIMNQNIHLNPVEIWFINENTMNLIGEMDEEALMYLSNITAAIEGRKVGYLFAMMESLSFLIPSWIREQNLSGYYFLFIIVVIIVILMIIFM